MHALIDSDSLCYKAGFVANKPEDEGLALWQLDGMVKGILQETNVSSYQLYLTGSDNFRYQVYQEYKGNRVGMARPVHLQAMREHLVVEWGAKVSDGVEADDDVGIDNYRAADEVAMFHVDKDLNMLAGRHYNYTKKEWYDVSDEQAMRHFFWQLIMGDKGDNIPGFDTLMRQTVPKKLQHHIDYLQEATSDEMLAHVFEMYQEDWKRFNLSAQCLWIWRQEDDDWTKWQNPDLVNELRIMGDCGQEDDLTASLQASSEVDQENGLQSTPF